MARDRTLHLNVELELARGKLGTLRAALATVLPEALRSAPPDSAAVLANLGPGIASLRRLHHVARMVCDSPHEPGRALAMVENLGRVCATLEGVERITEPTARMRILAEEKDSLEQLVMDVEEGKVAGRFRPGNHTLIEQVARDLKRSTHRLRKLDALDRALRAVPGNSWLGRGRREAALAEIADDHGVLLGSFGIRKRFQLDDTDAMEDLIDRVIREASVLRRHVRQVRDEVYRDEVLPAVELRDSGVDLESAKVVALLKDIAIAGLECVLRVYTIYDKALAPLRGGTEMLARVRALKHEIRDTEARTDTAVEVTPRATPVFE